MNPRNSEPGTQNFPLPTRDGSPTLYSERFGEHYHSIHGAVQESQHVFMEMGLKECGARESLRVLEMGFGTGLNALLTAIQATMPIHYIALEAYPITDAQVAELDYGKRLGHPELFQKLHGAPWDEPVALTPTFTLEKHHLKLEDFPGTSEIDLVFWDAFAPGSQPELWTESVFCRVFSWMRPGGILTTYCAKGDVRRAMIAAGFSMEKLPGPPGKREMLRGRIPV